MWTAKDLIRLRGCAGWSETSQAHVLYDKFSHAAVHTDFLVRSVSLWVIQNWAVCSDVNSSFDAYRENTNQIPHSESHLNARVCLYELGIYGVYSNIHTQNQQFGKLKWKSLNKMLLLNGFLQHDKNMSIIIKCAWWNVKLVEAIVSPQTDMFTFLWHDSKLWYSQPSAFRHSKLQQN